MIDKLFNLFKIQETTDTSRRSFLKKTTVATAGLTVLSQVPRFSLDTAIAANPKLLRFSVLDYGADPLGWFDSTFAIQSAINDARATGGYVTLPTGRYKITSPYPHSQFNTIY